MSRAALIMIIFSGIFSCRQGSYKTDITGHWCTCSRNGDYLEMYIRTNKYKFSPDFGYPSVWNAYEIRSDTFYQYDRYFPEDSITVNKAIFRLTNNGELEFDYLTSDEHWLYKRMGQNVQNIEDDITLKNETLKRAKKAACVDRRSDEEKRQDSLDRQIYFRF